MPNHIHIIIQITGGQRRPPLQRIIQRFKSATTNKYFMYNKGKLWQRNYYEHIIRNEKEYLLIKQYIQNNPLNWEKDKYY
ncbi:MAG: transposase [Clostridia bacterium]|nr:transposase [Clostridia bacterium]